MDPFLNALNNILMVNKFAPCCLSQAFLNLLSEPNVMIKKTINGFVNGINGLLSSAVSYLPK
ncbi:MAG TPA: hypothetical protein VHA33_20515 [Candidatus Angelobacter sp.]|nr:hypothetical protein [Candidatus Angelobacter sp.]